MVEALQAILPDNSRVLGIEPMLPKVEAAKKRNLPVTSAGIIELRERFDVISMMDIFSHIPDFRGFIRQLKPLLNSGGQVFVETGNGGDLPSADLYPDPLYLPDHLVFGGIRHLQQFFENEGFEVVSVKTERLDTMARFAKGLVKWLIGRGNGSRTQLPYSSPFRKVFLRARLVP